MSGRLSGVTSTITPQPIRHNIPMINMWMTPHLWTIPTIDRAPSHTHQPGTIEGAR
jgi:hypothetical protein